MAWHDVGKRRAILYSIVIIIIRTSSPCPDVILWVQGTFDPVRGSWATTDRLALRGTYAICQACLVGFGYLPCISKLMACCTIGGFSFHRVR